MKVFYHPVFKATCKWCGKLKKIVYAVGVYEFKRCPTCDYPPVMRGE